MWKQLPNYSNYEINENGDIRSKYYEGKMLKAHISKSDRNNKGYYVYTLYSDKGVRKTLKRSRLVAFAFIPNPDNLPEVDHIDEDTHNDHVSNLQWISRRDNHLRSMHKNSNYYSQEVKDEYYRMLDAGMMQKDISPILGVSKLTLVKWKKKREGSTTIETTE